MLRSALSSIALLAAMVFSAVPALAADPTLRDVYQAAEAGKMTEAQSMMDQVLRDHPNSAKAHFVEAELLSREGKVAAAQTELATAQRLEPGLPFAKPGSVSALEQRLSQGSRGSVEAPLRQASAPVSHFPWALVLMGLALLAAIVWFVKSLNRPQVIQAGNAAYPQGGRGFGGGFAQPMGAGGMGPVGPMGGGGGVGSGIMGGLATGAAVGAGLVAGEALMHHFVDGNGNRVSDANALQPGAAPYVPDANENMGGNDFGVNDPGSWDDNSSGDVGGDSW